MAVKWTEDQKRIIDFQGGNLIVAAGAGSGKTAVLTEHIIKKITDADNPVDLDQLLVVTFTNAAAAEMKERIRNKLEERIQETPNDDNLIRQMSLVSCADISTIHSFCLKVIREQFFRLDMDPGFRLGDTGELELLKNDLLDEIFEEQYSMGVKSFLDLKDAYSKVSKDEALKKLILNMYNYSNSYPQPDLWLEEALHDNLNWTDMLNKNMHNLVHGLLLRTDDLIDMASSGELPDKYVNVLKLDFSKFINLEKTEDLYEFSEELKKFSFDAKPRLTKNEKALLEGRETCADRVFNSRNDIKKKLEDLQKKYAFLSKDTLLYEAKEVEALNSEMVRITRLFAERFSLKKQSLGICDFSDLEHMALSVLYDNGSPSDVADTYATGYNEILIDEYQDCNQIQENILLAVSKERFGEENRFMVGDIKQSIYGFRMACPGLFLEKYNTYGSSDNNRLHKVELSTNFRSRSGVLGAINVIFSQIMTEELGGISYDGAVALQPGAAYFDRSSNISDMEILLLDRNSDDGGDGESDFDELHGYNSNEMQARMIGQRILELTSSDNPLMIQGKSPEETRRVRFRDIVILMRSLARKQEDYVRVLKEMGIPVYVENENGYFTSLEVSVMLDYLRIIDNPMQDIPLVSVLRSVIGGFTAQELAKIKIIGNGTGHSSCFYECCAEARKKIEKLDKFLCGLEQYRRLSKLIPIHDLILRISEETGFRYYVSALPQGQKRIKNLDMLAAKARNYENTSYRGLFHFIRYIDRIKEFDISSDFSADGDEDIDAVRIMTIHKSKGLEFPVVFLANANGDFTKSDKNDMIIMDNNYGIAADIRNPNFKYIIKTIKKAFASQKQSFSKMEEEMRLLYVALTRAKEKIIVAAGLPDLQKYFEEWSANSMSRPKAMDIGILVQAKSYLDWIMPAVLTAERGSTGYMRPVIVDGKFENILLEKCLIDIKRFDVEDLDFAVNETNIITDEGHVSLSERLKSILEYRYPYEEFIDMRAVMSVSEVKKKAYLYDDASEPDYHNENAYKDDKLNGAERGTAYHKVMELLDYSSYPEDEKINRSFICGVISDYVKKGLIAEYEAECVDIQDIEDLLNSPLGKRMIRASKEGKLFKEYPFLLGVKASEVSQKKASGDNPMVLIRGIIDCYFIEDDKIILVDYKTDRVKRNGGESKLVSRYKIQIEYYKKALEQGLNLKVSEACLYSFTLKKAIWVL